MRHVPATDEGSQGQLSVQREAGPSGYLKSTRRKIDGFCTLMQEIAPDNTTIEATMAKRRRKQIVTDDPPER